MFIHQTQKDVTLRFVLDTTRIQGYDYNY